MVTIPPEVQRIAHSRRIAVMLVLPLFAGCAAWERPATVADLKSVLRPTAP